MTKAWVGKPDYEAAARLGRVWEELSAKEKVIAITMVKPEIDAATSSMEQIEVRHISGGFTDTDEHEYSQWISEWEKTE